MTKGSSIERRSFAVDRIECRAAEAGGPAATLSGHAAVFGSPTQLWGDVWEQIAPGAFAASAAADDVRALWNHDPNHVLGRNKAGTLRMAEDAVGLAVEIDLPDTQLGRDLAVSIGRGDVSQMSFGFETIAERVEHRPDGTVLRTLDKVKLWDVSPVTFPAYTATDVSVAERSVGRWREEQAGPEPDVLRRRLELAGKE